MTWKWVAVCAGLSRDTRCLLSDRKRQKSSSSESSDGDRQREVAGAAPQGGATSSEDELDREERERLEDLAERDAFSERVKKRDKEKTRKVAEKSGEDLKYDVDRN